MPNQKYSLTLSYEMSELVSKLGEIWLFSEYFTWSGRKSGKGYLADPKSDMRVRFILPRLTKRFDFWKTVFFESKPLAREKDRKEESYSKELEWNESFTGVGDALFLHLVYGVRKREKLVNTITAIVTAILVGIVGYVFKMLGG